MALDPRHRSRTLYDSRCVGDPIAPAADRLEHVDSTDRRHREHLDWHDALQLQLTRPGREGQARRPSRWCMLMEFNT